MSNPDPYRGVMWGGDNNVFMSTDAYTKYEADFHFEQVHERLDKIEQMIGILSDPDPEMLKKYQSLKNAYDEYNLIEKLVLSQEQESNEQE
jgi:hypothetical protein